jgi:hypothetical protein
MKNPSLYLGDKFLYIVEYDRVMIHQYSKQDYSHLSRFGKKGEGPGEFLYGPTLLFYDQQIIASTFRKLSYFTSTGKLIEEKKVPQRVTIKKIFPDKFVASRAAMPKEIKGSVVIKSKITIVVLDSQLNEIREICTLPRGGMKWAVPLGAKVNLEFLPDYEGFKISQDKIFVGQTKKGFYFEVFSLAGEQLYEINVPFKKKKVTNQDKEALLKAKKDLYNQGRSRSITLKEYIKMYNKIVFPDFFPAYAYFDLFDDELYVFGHSWRDDRRECTILDQTGKVLKKVFLQTRNPFFIQNNKFYYLKENEEEEMWELHVEEI